VRTLGSLRKVIDSYTDKDRGGLVSLYFGEPNGQVVGIPILSYRLGTILVVFVDEDEKITGIEVSEEIIAPEVIEAWAAGKSRGEKWVDSPRVRVEIEDLFREVYVFFDVSEHADEVRHADTYIRANWAEDRGISVSLNDEGYLTKMSIPVEAVPPEFVAAARPPERLDRMLGELPQQPDEDQRWHALTKTAREVVSALESRLNAFEGYSDVAELMRTMEAVTRHARELLAWCWLHDAPFVEMSDSEASAMNEVTKTLLSAMNRFDLKVREVKQGLG
jgi:hypothetical protein